VLEDGNDKEDRSAFDWRTNEPRYTWTAYADKAFRHMLRWLQRNDVDESGHAHVHHAIVDLLILADLIEHGRGKDDRYEPSEQEGDRPCTRRPHAGRVSGIDNAAIGDEIGAQPETVTEPPLGTFSRGLTTIRE
jgi:hypothetical protein